MAAAGLMFRSWAPETVFLVVGAIAGVAFACLLPPAAGPDEPNHFHRAVQISDCVMVGERLGGLVGGYVPEALRRPWREVAREAATSGSLSLPGQRAFVDFRNTVYYSPIPYIPHALAIAVGRALGLAPLSLLLLARLAGLVAALALMCLAIRITPLAKWLFVALALSPMAIRQMSMISADNVTHACGFLLLALALRPAADRGAEAGGRWLAGLIGCALVLSLSKPAYLPMLMLYFLCPVAKVGSRRRYAAWFLAMAALCIGLQAAWLALNRDLYAPQQIAKLADPGRQLDLIFENPLRYGWMMAGHFWRDGPRYFRQALGHGAIIAGPWRGIHLTGLALTALAATGGGIALGLREKGLLAATAAATLAAILTMSYTSAHK